MGKGKADSILQMLYPWTGDQAAGGPQALPGSSKLSLLIDEIGFQRKWTQEQIDSDKKILFEQRLNTVDDARLLSKESWKALPLLPIVKDLIRSAIYDDNEKSEKKAKKYAEKAAMAAAPAPAAGAVEGAAKAETGTAEASCGAIDCDANTMDVTPSLTGPASAPRSNGRTVKSSDPVAGHRMRVDVDGATYEVDRLCPHKQVPLNGAPIMGGVLVCPKHKWKFDIKNGGMGPNGKSINACLVEW